MFRYKLVCSSWFQLDPSKRIIYQKFADVCRLESSCFELWISMVGLDSPSPHISRVNIVVIVYGVALVSRVYTIRRVRWVSEGSPEGSAAAAPALFCPQFIGSEALSRCDRWVGRVVIGQVLVPRPRVHHILSTANASQFLLDAPDRAMAVVHLYAGFTKVGLSQAPNQTVPLPMTTSVTTDRTVKLFFVAPDLPFLFSLALVGRYRRPRHPVPEINQSRQIKFNANKPGIRNVTLRWDSFMARAKNSGQTPWICVDDLDSPPVNGGFWR